MPRKPSPRLTDAEQRIMTLLWEMGEASVRDLSDALKATHGLAYTTVLTTVGIMTRKGYVDFRKVGRAHIYRPLLTQRGARRQALRSVIDSLFGGSPERLAQHLIEEEKLSLEDVEALRATLLDRDKDEESS